MNDFIFNVLPVAGPTIPACVPLIGGLPYNSPLTGSFLGVVFGFAVSTVWKWISDKRSGLRHIKLFKNELIQAKATLERDKEDRLFVNPLKERRPMRLQTDCWTSAVNHGDLRLHYLPEVDCLARVYLQLRNYNDDVQSYINHSNNRGFPVGTDINKDNLYYSQREHLGELNTKLIDGIDVVNGKKWMSSEHWWQRIQWQFWK